MSERPESLQCHLKLVANQPRVSIRDRKKTRTSGKDRSGKRPEREKKKEGERKKKETKKQAVKKKKKERKKKTRPDTRQSSRGRLGRSSNAKKRSKIKNVTDGPTDGRTYRPTDRHGKV